MSEFGDYALQTVFKDNRWHSLIHTPPKFKLTNTLLLPFLQSNSPASTVVILIQSILDKWALQTNAASLIAQSEYACTRNIRGKENLSTSTEEDAQRFILRIAPGLSSDVTHNNAKIPLDVPLERISQTSYEEIDLLERVIVTNHSSHMIQHGDDDGKSSADNNTSFKTDDCAKHKKFREKCASLFKNYIKNVSSGRPSDLCTMLNELWCVPAHILECVDIICELMSIENQNSSNFDSCLMNLTESYLSTDASMEFVSKYMVGIILLRIRCLSSTASRMLLKTIEFCYKRYPDLAMELIISKMIRPCPSLRISKSLGFNFPSTAENNELPSYSHQFELFQRFIRQASFIKRDLNALLNQSLAASRTFDPSSQRYISGSLSSTIFHSLLLMDALSYVSIQYRDSLCFKVNYSSLNDAPIFIPSVIWDIDALKSISSIVMMMHADIGIDTVMLLTRQFEQVTSTSVTLFQSPMTANLFHFIIQKYPIVQKECKDELVSILKKCPTIVARNALESLGSN